VDQDQKKSRKSSIRIVYLSGKTIQDDGKGGITEVKDDDTSSEEEFVDVDEDSLPMEAPSPTCSFYNFVKLIQ